VARAIAVKQDSPRIGIMTEKILSTVTAEVAEVLIGQCPWVLDMDVVAIEQYCRVEARVRLLSDYLDELIEEKGPGKVPPYIWGEITRAEANAMRRADSLGLSPEGRMKIAKDASVYKHFTTDRVGNLREQGRNLRSVSE
jgi:hypothetical protein